MFSEEKIEKLQKLAKLIRYWILASSTAAGSGHPTSALSAVELMTGLIFGGSFRYDVDHPEHPNNDRVLFSKGHATPLFYSLWAAAGKVTEEELMTYRKFGSPLEGHPTVTFPYVEAATGSLGQGLSIGVGLALNAKYLDKLPYRTYILVGDSEMAEGSQWEAMEIAAFYELDNLVGIVDVNRLGQRGSTMYEWDLEVYQKRISAFGWDTIVVDDGHSYPEVLAAYQKAAEAKGRPTMIIAKTTKGKGVSQVEDKNGWHGKALKEGDFKKAVGELGEIDKSARGQIPKPEDLKPQGKEAGAVGKMEYAPGESVPTRNAYGNALKRIYPQYPKIVSLDGEVSNSTRAEYFKEDYPKRFFEMYIAEQNMAGAALGLAQRGKIPFVSTFAAFLSRAFDQIRMSRYSDANIKFCGSHAGVSIGQDGPSQMGLEDMAMFRTILDGVVFYPCDAVSAEKMVELAARHKGIVYIRTTREGTPVIYSPEEEFKVGGCKVLRKSESDAAAVVGAGVTLHEALGAYEELKKEGISIRVIDLYCVKPVEVETLLESARAVKFILTVEDHYAEGGIGDAVRSALGPHGFKVFSLAVRRKPKSGKPSELLDFEEISRGAVARKVRELL